MAKNIQALLFLFFLLLPVLSKAQPSKLNPDKQLLLLQLSLNYYTVVKEGSVDQDSSLLIVSKKDHLSRWPVITEGFGDNIAISNEQWIDKRDTKPATNQLATLHGINHVKLLVLLGSYYAFQPGYHQKDRDSAMYFLSKAKQESEALHSAFWLNQSLCVMGKNYFKGNQVKEGIACFANLINSCKKNGDKAMEAKAWDYQGSYCPASATTIMLKINSIKKANDLYQETNQASKQINALMNMAYLGFLIKDVKGAETDAFTALQLQGTINFPYKHYSYDLLSMIYANNGNENKGLDYGLKAVSVSLATKDSIGLAYFYARVGQVRIGEKPNNSFSIYWYKKAIEEFSKNRDPGIYLTLSNLSDILLESGKSGEALGLLIKTLRQIPPATPTDKLQAYLSIAANYESLKNYTIAEKYYLLADNLANQNKLITKDFRYSQIKLIIARFLFKAKRYDQAKNYLQDFLTIPGPRQYEPEGISEANMMLYQIDSIEKNYEAEAKHLRQYILFNNAVIDSNDSKNIASMKIQFILTQREKDLQILQAKSTLQTQREAAIRKFIYIGIAVALLIMGMIYNRARVNKKNNKKLQMQKDEIDQQNHLLENLIHDKDNLLLSKEWLLKEVHHRVTNNLHTVICLLESQAVYLKNDALKAIENSQHRIYAMSLIHQKLYQSENIKTVDMSVYLPEFARYLNESFGTTDQIHFILDIEPLKLGVSYAVPISLIINEAVTNSIKYAFPENRKGIITISMHVIDDQVELVIADNGVGIAVDHANTPPNSLGLKLLCGLSEDIKAHIKIENSNGTTIVIKFPRDEMMYTVMS